MVGERVQLSSFGCTQQIPHDDSALIIGLKLMGMIHEGDNYFSHYPRLLPADHEVDTNHG